MEALTIRIYASSEGGYLYDIYKDDVVDEDLADDSHDGGHCTTTMLNALQMAVGQAENTIADELGEECPGCGEDMSERGKTMSMYGNGDLCDDCEKREQREGDFISQR